MRLRILELPVGHDPLTDDFKVPFLLVVDDWPDVTNDIVQQVNGMVRGIGAEGALVFTQRVELPPGSHDDWPHYTSTYCIHDRHADCRLSCKTCKAPCRCSCHDPDPAAEPEPVLIDERSS